MNIASHRFAYTKRFVFYVQVGCVMLSNSGEDYGALSAAEARKWATKNKIPFLCGQDVLASSQRSKVAKNGNANGNGHS